jgi:cellulose synthase/poly-beta-1,6-N-acetylglucosamine synthase-like glycosyltransferase
MDNIIDLLGYLLIFVSVYYISVSFFGFSHKKETEMADPENVFAIIIAAHNEESVIGALVENCRLLDYPREMYDIFVVADNCTDNTAQVAATAGAMVWKRFNDQDTGKGYALEWAFNRLYALPKEYDAVVIIDADNLVSLNYLKIMNNRLLQGERIIQGYLDSKNPDDTWVTRSIHVGYVITNRFWQLAKYNLGLCCALGGTGMCIAVDVLHKFGWGANSLTEDLEFQVKALLNGIKVAWAHEAKVFDEKPLTMKQSMKQRQRWMQGHCTVASRYVPKLLWEGIRQRNVALLDGALYCCNPYFLMFCGFGLLYQIFQGLPLLHHPEYMIVLLIQFIYFAIPMLLDRIKPSVFGWLFYYPVFAFTWIPVAYSGFATQSNRDWSHTQHTRDISWQELPVLTDRYEQQNQLAGCGDTGENRLRYEAPGKGPGAASCEAAACEPPAESTAEERPRQDAAF